MSLAAAHRFLALVRACDERGAAARRRLATLGDSADAEAIAAVAAELGEMFDAAALDRAWRQAWALDALSGSLPNGSGSANRSAKTEASTV